MLLWSEKKKGSTLSQNFRINTNQHIPRIVGISFGIWHQESAIKSASVSF